MLKNSVKYIHKNFIPLSVSIICVYALFLRIMSLYHHTLGPDELFQLNMMRGTFLDFLKAIPKHEPCSYLSGDYYLIYPFFKIFSYNKWGLAIPHVIATIIGFYLLYIICGRFLKSSWAYIITFGIVCFNATLIYHATEIRTYAVLPTLALATFYLFQRISDLNFGLNTPKRTAAIIFFVLVIWFHVYGIIMYASCFLYILISEYKERDFKVYFKNAMSFTAIVLCFAMPFWLYSVLGPHGIYTRDIIHIFDYIPNPLHNIVGFLKGIFCNLIGYKKLYFLFLGAILPFILPYKDRRKQLLFLFFSIIAPIVSILFLDVSTKYWFMQRQFIWAMPLFAFFLGWAWDSIFILLRHEKMRI